MDTTAEQTEISAAAKKIDWAHFGELVSFHHPPQHIVDLLEAAT